MRVDQWCSPRGEAIEQRVRRFSEKCSEINDNVRVYEHDKSSMSVCRCRRRRRGARTGGRVDGGQESEREAGTMLVVVLQYPSTSLNSYSGVR